MFLLKLLFKNAFRHKLRSWLTILSIAIAILAFGLLRTVVEAFYSGVERSSANRIVARNAISMTFSLPYSYKEKIKEISGVREVCRPQLVRRDLHRREEFLRELRGGGQLSRPLPGLPVRSRREEGLPPRPERGGHRKEARRPVRVEGGRYHYLERDHLPRKLAVHDPGHLHGKGRKRG